MTRKESHQVGGRGGSLEGCWKLAGGNTPGHRVALIPRPGRGAGKRKVIQSMQPKSTLDLGCAWPSCLILIGEKRLENKGKPGENRQEPAKKLITLKQPIRVEDGALRRPRRLKRRYEEGGCHSSPDSSSAPSIRLIRLIPSRRMEFKTQNSPFKIYKNPRNQGGFKRFQALSSGIKRFQGGGGCPLKINSFCRANRRANG